MVNLRTFKVLAEGCNNPKCGLEDNQGKISSEAPAYKCGQHHWKNTYLDYNTTHILNNVTQNSQHTIPFLIETDFFRNCPQGGFVATATCTTLAGIIVAATTRLMG